MEILQRLWGVGGWGGGGGGEEPAKFLELVAMAP